MYHLQPQASNAGGDTSLHTHGCSWVPRSWRKEVGGGGQGKSMEQIQSEGIHAKESPSSVPLGQAWEQRDPASCLHLWVLPRSQNVRRRAGEGAQELSDVVSGVTPLNKAHLSGRQRIQQDFCRPDCECCCQGFTISTNKHAGAAFGTTSSNIPGRE